MTSAPLSSCNLAYPNRSLNGYGALVNRLPISGERDIVITMDADATHMPGLIVQMVRMIGEGYDVVIASRYRAESRV